MLAQKKIDMVPPDGGFGWIIVCAMGFNSILFIPIMQNFGLIFNDQFLKMGFTATDSSIIMNTNAAFSMMSGIVNGPLLKIFGYRKIALLGSFLTFAGLVCTAFSNTFTTIFISYGFITSLGMGMLMSSYPLALNSYFRKKRNRAMGIALTITGLGPIVMPQLINLLLYLYDVQGTLLILGAITANGLASGLLLQPIKWHMVKKQDDVEALDKEKLMQDESHIKNEDDVNSNNLKAAISEEDFIHDIDMGNIYGFETPMSGSVLSLTGRHRRQSTASSYRSVYDKNNEKTMSSYSINHDNYKSITDLSGKIAKAELEQCIKPHNEEVVYNELSKKIQKPGLVKRCLQTIIHFFDLTLLKDPIYVNIMMGMSFAIFAELNFSLLTPFILADMNLERSHTATFLSILSIGDIVFRFFAPYIGDYLNKPPRIMYTITLFLLIITRFTLLIEVNLIGLYCIATGLGIAKGVRSVYMSLVIPSYVPIERLANASGIQSLVNGILILCGGPVLGIIRDLTGSYTNCIVVMNFVTFLTIFLWTAESLYLRHKRKKNSEKANNLQTNDF